MAKRRTSGIQRRERASGEALARRIEATGGGGLPDWRLLAIGGVLVAGVILVVLVLVLGAAPNPNLGVQQPDNGGGHVGDGPACRADPASCGLAANPYSSLPATSGPHWGTPAAWGFYSTPQPESQLIHNLEHGGIVIWYDATALDQAQLDELASYVEGQVATGIGGRFKFIASPWSGPGFGGVLAVTAWRQLLILDTFDMDAIRAFADANYLVHAPEPNGGPAPG
jgi:hypothetical protein